MKAWTVYEIRCIVDGRRYIGCTSNYSGPNNRIDRHFRSLRLGKHHSDSLLEAYQQYGPSAFVASAISQHAKEAVALRAEKSAIAKHAVLGGVFNSTARPFVIQEQAKYTVTDPSRLSDLLSQSEAAKLAGITHSLLSRHVRRGTAPCLVRAAGRVFFYPEDVKAWAAIHYPSHIKKRGRPKK